MVHENCQHFIFQCSLLCLFFDSSNELFMESIRDIAYSHLFHLCCIWEKSAEYKKLFIITKRVVFHFCFLFIQWKQFKCIIILFENSIWLLDRLCHFKCLIRKHMCDGIVTLWECSLYDFLKTLFRKSKMVASTGKSFNIKL